MDMWILEGKNQITHPDLQDIRKEFKSLKNKEDCVLLSNGDFFIQAFIHPIHAGYFTVEVSIPNDIKGSTPQCHIMRGPAGLTATKRIFEETLHSGRPTLDKSWKPLQSQVIRGQKTKGGSGRMGGGLILGALAMMLVGGTSLAAHVSGDSPLRGALAAGLGILFLAGMVPLTKLFFGRFVHAVFEGISIRMGMPARLDGRLYRIQVLDPTTHNPGRIFILYLLLWLLILLGILCTFAWLSLLLGLGLLLVRYV